MNIAGATVTFLATLSTATLLLYASASADGPKERIALLLTGSHCREAQEALEIILRHTDGVVAVDGNSVPGHLLIDVETGKTSEQDILSVVQTSIGPAHSCQVEVMRSCITAPPLNRTDAPAK